MKVMGKSAQTLRDGSTRPLSLPAHGHPQESRRPTPRRGSPDGGERKHEVSEVSVFL